MKKTFLTLTMGMALATSMVMTSCGEKKQSAEQAEASGEKTEAAAGKAKAQKPADLKVYKSSDLQAQMANEAANVGFDESVISTVDAMMENNKAVKAVYFDHKINMIGTASFKNCPNLEAVYFDEAVDVIGDEAFMGCTSLKEVKVTTSTLGLNAFDGCTSLEKVLLDQQGWKIRDNALANCPALKTIIIPMTIDAIEEDAFKGSAGIEELAIPYNFKDRMYTFCSASKNIKKIYILTPALYQFPTTAAAKAFNKAQCEAYVPDALIKDFQGDETWSGFAAIKPLSESGYFNADSTIK